MAHSLFSGLELARTGEGIVICCPERLVPYAAAARVAPAFGLAVEREGETWRLRGPHGAEPCPAVLKRFFATLHGTPAPYPAVKARCRLDTATPLVSCIVLLNENAMFVQEQLLPSLAAHAADVPLEVVLVQNGSAAPVAAPLPLRTVQAPWGAVAAGYNAGARLARGAYLAFLHDDCIIDDPAWIEKCIAALRAGHAAAAAEYRQMPDIEGVTIPGLLVAKCVPLVIRRETFFETGGYDEFHYVGYEDLDFTLALLERGRDLAAVNVRVRHYGGMSSTLKYCPVPGLDALYAMTAVPAGAIRQAFREYTAARAAADPADLMLLALDVQKLYVLKKYRRLLRMLDADAHAQAMTALERRITLRARCDPHLILPRFREQDRMTAARPVAGAGA